MLAQYKPYFTKSSNQTSYFFSKNGSLYKTLVHNITKVFIKMCGFYLKSSFGQKNTYIRNYNTLVPQTLLPVSKFWTIKAKGKAIITVAQMKSIQQPAKYTWKDYKRNKTF
jgi:hypothetical protein